MAESKAAKDLIARSNFLIDMRHRWRDDPVAAPNPGQNKRWAARADVALSRFCEVERYERRQHSQTVFASGHVPAYSGGPRINNLAAHNCPNKFGGRAQLGDSRSLGCTGRDVPAWSAISAADASTTPLRVAVETHLGCGVRHTYVVGSRFGPARIRYAVCNSHGRRSGANRASVGLRLQALHQGAWGPMASTPERCRVASQSSGRAARGATLVPRLPETV